MTAKFSKRDAKAEVAEDIEHANMRMIYENSADYAAWRQRMGLAKPLDPRVDPVMRHRIAGLFNGLAGSLGSPYDKPRRTPQVRPDEWLREYGRQPLPVSDALQARIGGIKDDHAA